MVFECHDCDTELIIVDPAQELEPDDIAVCPVCGSKNIFTSEKRT